MKNKVKKWLNIKDYSNLLKKEVDEIRKQVLDDVAGEIKHWTQTVERIGEIECSFCQKKIVTYPFGGGYYRESDGSVICSKQCLDDKKLESNK